VRREETIIGSQEAQKMTKVLVVYGSRHGGTRGIAERIGDTLRLEGLDVEVAAADHVADVGAADAFVVGSGVYMGSWLKEPLGFLQRNEATLSARLSFSLVRKEQGLALWDVLG
jgi:menaquinone-dependent protoporphyrinogen oxidase